MSLVGRFFLITGGFLTVVFFGIAALVYLQELLARRSLPAEMQTAEMIQRHFDGEVILGSITSVIAFLVLGSLAALVFGVLTGICELVSINFSERTESTSRT